MDRWPRDGPESVAGREEAVPESVIWETAVLGETGRRSEGAERWEGSMKPSL